MVVVDTNIVASSLTSCSKVIAPLLAQFLPNPKRSDRGPFAFGLWLVSGSYAAFLDAAEGGKADIAKPMHGMGSGIFKIALPFVGDAFRVVYAVQLGEEIWVAHAFQKKSTQSIKTPKREIDLMKYRLKKLKEMLR